MTVADVICKIGKARETIDCLERISAVNDFKNGAAMTVVDAVNLLEEYIDTLENKIVK